MRHHATGDISKEIHLGATCNTVEVINKKYTWNLTEYISADKELLCSVCRVLLYPINQTRCAASYRSQPKTIELIRSFSQNCVANNCIGLRRSIKCYIVVYTPLIQRLRRRTARHATSHCSFQNTSAFITAVNLMGMCEWYLSYGQQFEITPNLSVQSTVKIYSRSIFMNFLIRDDYWFGLANVRYCFPTVFPKIRFYFRMHLGGFSIFSRQTAWYHAMKYHKILFLRINTWPEDAFQNRLSE